MQFLQNCCIVGIGGGYTSYRVAILLQKKNSTHQILILSVIRSAVTMTSLVRGWLHMIFTSCWQHDSLKKSHQHHMQKNCSWCSCSSSTAGLIYCRQSNMWKKWYYQLHSSTTDHITNKLLSTLVWYMYTACSSMKIRSLTGKLATCNIQNHLVNPKCLKPFQFVVFINKVKQVCLHE